MCLSVSAGLKDIVCASLHISKMLSLLVPIFQKEGVKCNAIHSDTLPDSIDLGLGGDRAAAEQ